MRDWLWAGLEVVVLYFPVLIVLTSLERFWSGMRFIEPAAMLLALGVTVLNAFISFRRRRRRRILKALARRANQLASGRCPQCGYSTFGLPSPRCPECGGDIHLQHLNADAGT